MNTCLFVVSSIRLFLNTKKTKEICVARSHYMPWPLDDVVRIASAKLLGVIFQENFKMDMHDIFVLNRYKHRLYLLNLLRSQGLCTVQL